MIKKAFSDNKYLLLISAIIFFITLFLGFILHFYLFNYFNPPVEQLKEGVSSGAIPITFQSIFINNIIIVFRMFILGAVFCFSAIILAYNGFFLGYFIADTGNLIYSILLIVPHGIFEIPSIIIATSSGFILFKFLFNNFSLKNSKGYSICDKFSSSILSNMIYLKQSCILLIVSSILMIIAGIIEVYFTRDIALFFMNLLGLFK